MIIVSLIAAAAAVPADKDVKAGWLALVIFLLLALAVAFLGFSLTKHLRRAELAKSQGLYGDEPVEAVTEPAGSPEDPATPSGPATPA